MAKINEELTLVDKFSGAFNKFIDCYQKSAEMAQKTTQATQKMANTTNTAAAEAAGDIVKVSDATQDLVDKLLGYEQAVVHAFTDKQKQLALNDLEKQMDKLGLAFTNAGQEAYAAELLMSDGLQELANQGAIAASYMAEMAYNTEEVTQKQSGLFRILQSVGNAASNAVSKMMGFKDVQNPLDGVINKLTRMVVYFFSVRKLISYIKDALKRTPDEIASSFTTLKTTIGDSFAGIVVSAIDAMRKGVDRLNQAFQSEAGQKFLRGLETAAAVAGRVVGFLADGVAQLIEFMGNNFQTVMGAAAVVVGLFAAKMLIAAVSSMIAHLPLLLLIGTVVSLISWLMRLGNRAGNTFSTIAKLAGGLYATCYNLIADIWNFIATFAEFFANVFNNPVASIVALFGNLFNWFLGLMGNIAGILDMIFGTNFQTGIDKWRAGVQKWVDDKTKNNDNYVKIDRMTKLNVKDTSEVLGNKITNAFSNFSLSNMMPTAIKDLDSIDASVGSIEKSVSAADEDIKSLVDLAERRYVAQVNLTSQTPVINVSGQNTGSTAADRKALADALAEVLVEQASAGSTLSTASAF